MDKILTIAITTYNRKERLLNQLHSIYKQPESDLVKVVIIDNHSDYNVKEAIIGEFGLEIASQIDVNINPVNFGMCANLAMPFLHCNTPWLWTLSDDDETLVDSISVIYKDIKQYPDTIMFKYAIDGGRLDNLEFTSLEQLVDYYYDRNNAGGHLIFLSNNIYSMKYAMQYYGNTLSNCFCCISQMLPMFYALNAKAGVVRFRSNSLVRYIPPIPGTGYHYLNTAVEISSIAMFPFKLTDTYHKKLGFVVCSGFSHYKLIYNALHESEKKRGKFLYNQVYNRSFKFSGNILDKIYHFYFYFGYITGITVPLDVAQKVRANVRKFFPRFR